MMHRVAWFCSAFFVALLCFYGNQSQFFFRLSFSISTSCPILIRALHVQGENRVHLQGACGLGFALSGFLSYKRCCPLPSIHLPTVPGPLRGPRLTLTLCASHCSALLLSTWLTRAAGPSHARALHSPTVPWPPLLCAPPSPSCSFVSLCCFVALLSLFLSGLCFGVFGTLLV